MRPCRRVAVEVLGHRTRLAARSHSAQVCNHKISSPIARALRRGPALTKRDTRLASTSLQGRSDLKVAQSCGTPRRRRNISWRRRWRRALTRRLVFTTRPLRHNEAPPSLMPGRAERSRRRACPRPPPRAAGRAEHRRARRPCGDCKHHRCRGAWRRPSWACRRTCLGRASSA